MAVNHESLRPGMLILAQVRGGSPSPVLLTRVLGDVKNGEPGWDGIQSNRDGSFSSRWGYTSQAERVLDDPGGPEARATAGRALRWAAANPDEYGARLIPTDLSVVGYRLTEPAAPAEGRGAAAATAAGTGDS